MKKIIAVGCLIVAASGVAWGLTALRPTQGITFTHAPLTASDLAAVQHQHIIKLQISLPEEEYTLHVWSEQWEKGASKPSIELLATFGEGKFSGDSLLFALPNSKDSEWFVSVGGVSAYGKIKSMQGTPGGFSTGDGGAVQVDGDIYLASTPMQVGSSNCVVGPVNEVNPSNDLTYIYKARFSRGNSGSEPKWVNGRVEFSKE